MFNGLLRSGRLVSPPLPLFEIVGSEIIEKVDGIPDIVRGIIARSSIDIEVALDIIVNSKADIVHKLAEGHAIGNVDFDSLIVIVGIQVVIVLGMIDVGIKWRNVVRCAIAEIVGKYYRWVNTVVG